MRCMHGDLLLALIVTWSNRDAKHWLLTSEYCNNNFIIDDATRRLKELEPCFAVAHHYRSTFNQFVLT